MGKNLHGRHGMYVRMLPKPFKKLSNCPQEVSDDDLQKLENFVVLMYDRSSAASCVNDEAGSLCPQAEDLRCDSTNQSCLIEGAR